MVKEQHEARRGERESDVAVLGQARPEHCNHRIGLITCHLNRQSAVMHHNVFVLLMWDDNYIC